MELRPLRDQVCIRANPVSRPEGSLIIANASSDSTALEGTVIAVGPGRYCEDTNERIPCWYSVGDTVMFDPKRSETVPIEDGTVLYMAQEDNIIVAVGN